MNDIQEIIKILAPITLLITAIAGLLNAIVKSAEIIEQLLSKLRPGFRFLLLGITQIVPIACVIWNFMYIAATYPERLTEKIFFLLIVLYPTLLICAYETFWGITFYPKLLSNSKDAEVFVDKSKPNQVHNKRRKS